MADIYDQHKAAFSNVSAFVILDNLTGERVATVALKFPRDGAGRLFAYVHIIGLQMVRAYAGGYGYDKRGAAVAAAVAKIKASDARLHDGSSDPFANKLNRILADFQAARPEMDSRDWTRAIEARGYQVIQAV